jgi:HEAT repeat protein
VTPDVNARSFGRGRGVPNAGTILIGAALAALLIGSVAAVLRAVKAQTNFIDVSRLATSDPSMVAISAMVERGDVWGAGARIGSSYRFDQPAGLMALREFSVLVLRRGLVERDRYERCYVKSALAAAGDRDEVVQLVNIFRNTSELNLKMAIADGLGDAGAAGTLLRLYIKTQPAYRRILVNGAARSRDPRVIDLLEQALIAPDRTTRLTAAKGLGQLGSRAAIPVLRRFIAAADDPLEKAMAAWSLLRLGDRSAEEAAISILSGRNDDDARAVAAVALGRAREPGAVEALRRAMSGDKIDIRIGAAAALTHYGDPQAVIFLLSAVQDEDSVTRLHVGQLLDEMDFGNARMVVRSAVSSPDPELNLLGIRAIGISGSAEDIPFLLDAADRSGDPIARAEAAWALGRLGCRASVAPLIAMISEPDHSVRYTAADALDHAAMELLRKERARGA